MQRIDFSKGLNTDVGPLLQPEGTHTSALNLTAHPTRAGRVNEGGNVLSADAGGKILGITYIEQQQWSVVFVLTEEGDSRVSVFDHVSEEITPVVTDRELGCSWNFSAVEYMYAEAKEHGVCDDLLIYFSSNCTYYVVNVTEMLDPVRRAAVLASEPCGYFEVGQPLRSPKVNVTPVDHLQSTLEAGAVAFAVRLGDDDANHTNWFPLSSTVTIRSEHNRPGQRATSAVEVLITGLDERYNNLDIAVVRTSAGVTTVQQLPKVNYSGTTYSLIYYGQRGVETSLASITTTTNAYLRGKDLLQYEGRMLYYNVKRNKNLNYQKYANEIIPSVVVYQVSLREQMKHRFPSLPRGENMAPAIVFNYADGSQSAPFGIYGVPLTGNSTPPDPSAYCEGETARYDYTGEQRTIGENPGIDLSSKSLLSGISPDLSTPTRTVGPTLMVRDRTISRPVSTRPIRHLHRRNDPWVDNTGKDILTEHPRRINTEHPLSPHYSTLDFPDTLDCFGERMFPEGKVFSYAIPGADKIPHYSNFNSGVTNKFQSSNDVYRDIKINLLGWKFDNIHLPTEDELPQPLDPAQPYKIVYVKRGVDNSTVVANGWTGGTYVGENRGQKYYFQRHGVNSKDNVFRGVSSRYERPEEQGGGVIEDSRFADANAVSRGYTFHSPDTDLTQGRIDATEVVCNFGLRGAGWRYGLHAKGRPPADAWTGQRIDQRGCRTANNLTGVDLGVRPKTVGIASIAPTVTGRVINPTGATHPVDSVYNESSVFIETSDTLPGNDRDNSFIGDTVDHQGALYANSTYVTLKKTLEAQYGGAYGRSYIDTGLVARKGQTSVEGICGDVFIGPYSKRRTSFVSEKVGEGYRVARVNPDSVQQFFQSQTVCDTNESVVYELLGLNINQDGPPEPGDYADARNYAGLYTDPSPPVLLTKTYSNREAYNASGPLTDVYYPGTTTGVVYSIVESRIPAWERMTGDPKQDQIFAERLQNYHLDSDVDHSRPWDSCYLNHVNYVPVEQASRKQVSLVALIKSVVMLLIPATMLDNISDVDGIFDAISTSLADAGLTTLLMVAANTLFTKDTMRKLVGMEPCIGRDSEGAFTRFKSEAHKDNYNEYNFDYAKQTTENQYIGITSLYNTCDCSSCEGEDRDARGAGTSKEIYSSAQQGLDTEIDAYRTVRIANYNELPAHAGNLRKLFVQQGRLFAHTTRGIYAIRTRSEAPTDLGGSLTGSGELLMDMQLIAGVGTDEGYAGTNFPNASINVPAVGYFFVDDAGRKIYRFDGKLDEISARGMRQFFLDHLPFCSEGETHDENAATLAYRMTYDGVDQRLLFTKLDGRYSFTISYSVVAQSWISFHSYTPAHYLRTRYDLFSVVDGQIWRHTPGANFHRFYGVQYAAMLEVVLTHRTEYFQVDSVGVMSSAERGGHEMIDLTYDAAVVFNYQHSTGLLALRLSNELFIHNESQAHQVKERITEVNISRNQDIFNINDISNNIDLTCGEFVSIKGNDTCSVIPALSNEIDCLSVNGSFRGSGGVSGRWVKLRLYLQQPRDTKLTTYFLEWRRRGDAN